jgi:hypothetical protein
MAKMTKVQEKHEVSISSLEEEFKSMIAFLRSENEQFNFKKKQVLVISEMKYMLSGVRQRLGLKDSGPLQW